mmetsp:Transcript_47979/g.155895  ORF Transcript_47979/g.155895 Transcript_47979/m.155895 type:complete len:277 (-) Transcript_47979:83-913(-)
MRTTSALTLTPAPHPDLSLQRLSPSLNASLFFAALRDANAPRAAELSQARVVRGLWKQALLLAARICSMLLVGGLLLIVLVASLPLLIPLAIGALSASTIALPAIAIAVGAALVCSVVARSALFSSLLRVMRLVTSFAASLSVETAAFALLALLLVGGRVVPLSSVEEAARHAAYLAALSAAQGELLLTQLSIRLTKAEWLAWSGERRWQLLGLGLPAALLMYFAHPRLALASLELLQGSAAVFYGQEEVSADVEQKNSADGREAGSRQQRHRRGR